tara:strand:+ start:2063 stop:2428 length:366 start_codon:yes stop_codon:yes gene_type:complete
MNAWEEGWPELPGRYLDLILTIGLVKMDKAVEQVITSCETPQIKVAPKKVNTWDEDDFLYRSQLQRTLAQGQASFNINNRLPESSAAMADTWAYEAFLRAELASSAGMQQSRSGMLGGLYG